MARELTKEITPPADQNRGISLFGQKDWEKKWITIFHQVNQVTKRSQTDTLVDLTSTGTQELTRCIDPWDNQPEALANALVRLLEVNRPKALVGAICPPYSLPGNNPAELEAETGKTFDSFNPQLISQGMENLGRLIRALTDEPVELDILSLTSLGTGQWTPLVINPAVYKTYSAYGSKQMIENILKENTELVKNAAEPVLSQFNIQLNVFSLDSVLANAESAMLDTGFSPVHLSQLNNIGSTYNPKLFEEIASLIPPNIRDRYFSHDRESSISWAWKSFGADSALFNFYFYMALGQTIHYFPSRNNGSIINFPLEIDAGNHPDTFYTFSAGWHGLLTSASNPHQYWGSRQIPMLVPRPVVHLESNGKIVQNQSGIRQRW